MFVLFALLLGGVSLVSAVQRPDRLEAAIVGVGGYNGPSIATASAQTKQSKALVRSKQRTRNGENTGLESVFVEDVLPTEPGCYYKMLESSTNCGLRSLDWKPDDDTSTTTKELCEAQKANMATMCNNASSVWMFVPGDQGFDKDGEPTKPGCYYKQQGDLTFQCGGPKKHWTEDTWGPKNGFPTNTRELCEGRKGEHDKACGVSSEWQFVPGTSNSAIPATANSDQPAIDGAWGEWAEWGECSTSCAWTSSFTDTTIPGIQTRKREVETRPSNGGDEVSGFNSEMRDCPNEVSPPCTTTTTVTYSMGKIEIPFWVVVYVFFLIYWPILLPLFCCCGCGCCYIIAQSGKKNTSNPSVDGYDVDDPNQPQF